MRKTYIALINSLILLATIGLFVSCDFFPYEPISVTLNNNIQPINELKSPEIKNRIWSILIYMAADNDLEAAAMEDLFEMEVSKLNTKEVSIFVLLDRSDSHDTSNKDWTGSKLFKLNTGRSRECKTIISEEIPCESLGMYKDKYTELDMASGYTLSTILDYIKKQYPAEQLGLIMWGHGTGWRGKDNNENVVKGFAYDRSTGNSMTLKQMGDGIERALNNEQLDFLGLDTCCGGEIEVMYELRNRAKYAVGTEGLLLYSGWNYETIWNNFQRSVDKSPRELSIICKKSFEQQYGLSTSASICCVDMSKMNDYFRKFDLVMQNIANDITNKEIRDKNFNCLYAPSHCITKSYSYGETDSDVYLDINSAINTCLLNLEENELLNNLINDFNTIEKQCIFSKWSSDTTNSGLGVYFGTLTSGNLISKAHNKAYMKNSMMEQIQFVKDSSGYVPGQLGENSFIDKLFYCDY